jgi:hypothetical protein
MDTRTVVLGLARGRVVTGLALLLLPGVVTRVWLGESTPSLRGLARMMGARDLMLGVGTITSVKERTQGPEWASAAAFADGVDAVVSLFAPGVPKRARLVGLAACGAAAVGIVAARQMADERAAEQAAVEAAELGTAPV